MAIITNYLLFNHTYLRKLQADSSVDERASFVAQGVRDWYGFRDDTSIESLVSSWVQPVLNSLELDLQSLGQGKDHVYLLYRLSDWSEPVGLCYVTPPGADLDTTTKGRHWMAQAVLAARRWEPVAEGSGESEAEDGQGLALRWVILTNGHQWRLLDAQALRRYEAYLQVDLEELVRNPSDLSALRVFYHCFHRSAFERDAASRSGLDRLLDESDNATKKAEDHLKACVSANEGVMARLCLGLVKATGQDHFTEEERDAIYRDATYLLYRLLFILYAEARNLLPMDIPAYQQASLGTLVETAHTYNLQGIPDPQATTLWQRLKRLCIAIYESDPELGIPAYNGGLFDDGDKPHLREGTIADGHLTQALFDLTYQLDGVVEDGYSRIDYRDLSVRHLGSVYEGMIEYKLQIAEETLWARRDGKGNVRFLRTGQDGAPQRNDVEVKKGDVYFSQSPGERKATGTYYTPEYVVDYIVRQTVMRGLAERRASLEASLPEWLDEIEAALSLSERERMQHTADEDLLRFVEEEVLTFRVCDPAMGSGHFLVNAAHQMTNTIVETLHLTPWLNEAVETDPLPWRRRIVEHCLYGVDLSQMAVELAKLSLWLASVAEGKPLSFLDHHLRRGNSLIGARLDDLARALEGQSYRSSRREQKARKAGQLSMLDQADFNRHATRATNLLIQISARTADTAEDVKTQEAEYAQVRSELELYRQLANLWAVRHFDVPLDRTQFRMMAKYLIDGSLTPVPEYERLLAMARHLASEQSFFHWELEFPQVFLKQDSRSQEKNSMFDAVLGNPPYMNTKEMNSTERAFCYSSKGGRPNYKTANTKSNLYAMFWERAISLTRQGGYLSLITPYSWLSIRSFENLRELFLEELDNKEIILLPVGVFDAGIATSILVAEKSTANGSLAVRDLRGSNVSELDTDLETVAPGRYIPSRVFQESKDHIFNLEWNPDKAQVMGKMRSVGTPLGDLAIIDLGMNTTNDGKYVGTVAKNDWNPKKLLTGSDFGRYISRWGGLYVYYLPDQMKRESSSARPGEPERFERKQKIILYRFLDSQGRFVCIVDDQGYYSLGSTYVVALRDPDLDLNYVVSILNSRLIAFFNTQAFSGTKITRPQVESVPIRVLKSGTSEAPRVSLSDEATHLYNVYPKLGNRSALAQMVKRQLGQEPVLSEAGYNLLIHLSKRMTDLYGECQRLEQDTNLFHFIEQHSFCLRLEEALGDPLRAGDMVTDVSSIQHDIEGLCLTQAEDGKWLLNVLVKLRDGGSNWREYQRDQDGNFIREWLPAFRLSLDEATGRFYHYAFANLDGFDGAKIPGGYTSTTLEKLQSTKVPKFVPVDLAPLATLEAELAEVRRKIQLTDDLIDQIVYRLYGLTEEEIAIVEGKA